MVRRGIVLAYIAALHAALVLTLFQPEAVWRRINQVWPSPSGETVSAFRRSTRIIQRTIDITVRPNAVWFFGDSIIQMMDTGRITERAINLGIGEDTVTGVLARVGDHPALSGAVGIVLAIGTNDLAWRTASETAKEYERLLAVLPPEVPVIVSAVLLVDERVRARQLEGRNAKIAVLNAGITRLCAARGRCYYVDAGPALVDETGNLAPKMHRGDGLHLSQAGYRTLIDTLITPVRDRLLSRG
jgi:lysophospholipase L1-like esterase